VSCYEIIHRNTDLADFCKISGEPSGFIKGRKFLDWLSDCQLLRQYCSMKLVSFLTKDEIGGK
jgi:hypothetical protein